MKTLKLILEMVHDNVKVAITPRIDGCIQITVTDLIERYPETHFIITQELVQYSSDNILDIFTHDALKERYDAIKAFRDLQTEDTGD